MLNAIIIDDMPNAIEALRQDISDYLPNVQIIGTANSVISGAKLLNKTETDIVFLDIELGDGTGFDILELSNNKSFKVIFTTGSDAFAIKAFKFSAVDYLLKPIDPDELIAAVKKVETPTQMMSNQLELLKGILTKEQKDAKIALSTQEQIKISKIQDIVFCKSDGNYTTFHFQNEKALMVSGSMKHFEELLGAHTFYRTHQSYLVNLNHVQSFIKTEGGYLQLSEGSRIPVSVRKKQALIDILKHQAL